MNNWDRTGKGHKYLGHQRAGNAWGSKGTRIPGTGQQRATNNRDRTGKGHEYLRQQRPVNIWGSKGLGTPGTGQK